MTPAPVRYTSVRPGARQVDVLDALKAICRSFTDEHGVIRGHQLSDEEALAIVVELRKFGYDIVRKDAPCPPPRG